MNDLLVIGSVALDTITTPAGHSKEILGGSATYFSISASYFTNVKLVAAIGNDFPERYKKILQTHRVDISGLETQRGKTFRWEGSYVEDLNCAKTIKTELNVFKDFKPSIPNEYINTRYIFLANIDPDQQLFILKNLQNPEFIGCDSMNYWITTKKASLEKLLKKCSVVFLNDSEARMFSGESNILKSGKFIVSLGPKFVIIKRGEYGSILFGRDFTFILPAYLLEEVKDPTGAGDSFAGGFMGYAAKTGRIDAVTLKSALLYGTIMASFTVQDFSINRFLKLDKKEIEKRHSNFKKLISLGNV